MRTCFFVVIFLMSVPAHAEEYDERRSVQFVSNYDGDTITVNVPGWPPIIGQGISVRIFGIDTPEMHDRRVSVHAVAVQARDLVHSMLSGVQSVEIRHVQRDKYFRILAEVWVDGVSVASELLRRGLARPYDGGTKMPW